MAQSKKSANASHALTSILPIGSSDHHALTVFREILSLPIARHKSFGVFIPRALARRLTDAKEILFRFISSLYSLASKLGNFLWTPIRDIQRENKWRAIRLKLDMKPVYIYALLDPITLEVKYVGQTVDPKIRLYAHIRSAIRGGHRYSHSEEMRQWILNLDAQGLSPQMIILQQIPHLYDRAYSNRPPMRPYDSGEREMWWVIKMRSMGFRLLNSAGGRGFQKKHWLQYRNCYDNLGNDDPECDKKIWTLLGYKPQYQQPRLFDC